MTSSFAALDKERFAGKRLGRFEVLCKLGEGGMSEVFLGWQRGVGGFARPVVLKRIRQSVRRHEEFLRMFVKEAKISAGLSHGGIAHLYELSHDGDELFMVMEFVPGATLVEIARACHLAKEPIPIGFTLGVIRDVALALHYAHTFVDATGKPAAIVHRDVAEKNVMVSFDGTAKLLDFGIARQSGSTPLTQAGTVKGTAGYMSPEQVRGEPLDGRADVFSLGIVMHECLTGDRLFRRDTLAAELQALLDAPVPLPSSRNHEVPVTVDPVVMKTLERDIDRRFSSARELAEAIDLVASGVMWSQTQRAQFMQRHFSRRQADITAMLDSPSVTNIDELLAEPSGGFERVRRQLRPSGREGGAPSGPRQAVALAGPGIATVPGRPRVGVDESEAPTADAPAVRLDAVRLDAGLPSTKLERPIVESSALEPRTVVDQPPSHQLARLTDVVGESLSPEPDTQRVLGQGVAKVASAEAMPWLGIALGVLLGLALVGAIVLAATAS